MNEIEVSKILFVVILSLLIAGGASPLSAKKTFSDSYVNIQNPQTENLSSVSKTSRYKINFTNENEDPASVAKQYLVDHADIYGGQAVVEELEVLEVVYTKASVHVRFQQRWNGIPVYASSYNVSLNLNNEVSMVVASFIQDVNVNLQQPVISGNQAKYLVNRHVGGGVLREQDNPVELMIYRDVEDQDHIVQVVNYPSSNPQGDWEVIVDARTSEFLELRNRLLYLDATGKVFLPDPLSTAEVEYGEPGYEDNDDADSEELNNQRVLVTLRDVRHDFIGYHLEGPYVCLTDFEEPFILPVIANTDTGFSFTRSNHGFEEVNAYYHIDSMQRYIQSLGIEDLQNGPIDVDAHAVNGADLSYYSPTLNALAFGNGGVDDAEDADVIIHEYGHALHYAAVGDLVSNDMRSISEGISDFLAGSYSAKITTFNQNRVFNWDGFNPFFEGRTLDSDGVYPDDWTMWEYYENGSIWANTLWRIHERIEPDSADAIILHSMYYQGPQGNVIDAAEALLQAEMDLFAGRYRTPVYESLVEKGFLQPTLSLEPIELIVNLERNTTLDTNIVITNNGGDLDWVGDLLPLDAEQISPMTHYTGFELGWNNNIENFSGITVMENGYYLTANDNEQNLWLLHYDENGEEISSRLLNGYNQNSFTDLTNDGEFIYGISDNAIVALSLDGTPRDTTIIRDETTNILTYQPDEDVFWVVQNDSTIISIDRLGIIQDTLVLDLPVITGLSCYRNELLKSEFMVTTALEQQPMVCSVNIATGEILRRYDLPQGFGRVHGSSCGVFREALPEYQIFTSISEGTTSFKRLDVFLLDWHFSYLEVERLTGSIASNSTDTLSVHVSAENLEGGQYYATVFFHFEEISDTLVLPFKLSVITVNRDESLLPDEFSISNAYPNPFNSTVKVEMVLPKTMDVQMAVYNLLGRRVYSREMKALGAGKQYITWHANNHLSSGMYFIKFRAEGYNENIQKVLLIR